MDPSHLLILMPLLPVAGAILVLSLPHDRAARAALGVAACSFATGMGLYYAFDPQVAGPQFEFKIPWIPPLGLNYHLGLDGLSLSLVLLTTFLMPWVILSSAQSTTYRIKAYLALILTLEGLLLGAFLARDLVLFTLFWELALLPVYLMIGVWGGQNRIYAAVKFWVYNGVGSALLIAGLLGLYLHKSTPSLSFISLYEDPLMIAGSPWIFMVLALAFAIKMPIWPVHTWLPDAQVEAPRGTAMALAGLVLNLGAYGFFRLALPLFPPLAADYFSTFALLALIGILSGALIALVQTDMKRWVRYLSLSHMGVIALGFLSLTPEGMTGAMVQMINFGLIFPALFLVVGLYFERRQTRMFRDYGGLAQVTPKATGVFLLFALAAVGMPGLSGFTGLFLVMVGLFEGHPLMATLVGCLMVIGTAALLSFAKAIFWGPLVYRENRRLSDFNGQEWASILPLIVAVLGLGLYPQPILGAVEKTVAHTIEALALPAQNTPDLGPPLGVKGMANPEIQPPQQPTSEAGDGILPKTVAAAGGLP